MNDYQAIIEQAQKLKELAEKLSKEVANGRAQQTEYYQQQRREARAKLVVKQTN